MIQPSDNLESGKPAFLNEEWYKAIQRQSAKEAKPLFRPDRRGVNHKRINMSFSPGASGGLFGPTHEQIRLKDHIRKLDDISKKGANSEYFNEMYLSGGIHDFDRLLAPKKVSWWKRLFKRATKQPIK